MKTIFVTAIFLVSSASFAKELLCFNVSTVAFQSLGQLIEHEVSAEEALTDPESYVFFDLGKLETTLFWEGLESRLTREVQPLKGVNDRVFIGEIDVSDGTEHSVYMFNEEYSELTNIELGTLYVLRCEEISLVQAEKKYALNFSAYTLE